MTPIDSQKLESYEPVYDVVPEKWEDARAFFTEQLKRHALAINSRGIGFFLDQELLTGQSFIPGVNNLSDGGTSQSFRSILRKVIPFPGLTPGVNTQPHGIFIDANFTLLHMYGAATNSTALVGNPLPLSTDIILYNSTNVIVNSTNSYDRAYIVMEYTQEL